MRNLPPGLAQWLKEQGYEAEHVRDVGLHGADDVEIWKFAMEKGSVIITKDEDFAERAAHSKNSPRIVWLRVGNTANAALKIWLSTRLKSIITMLDRGDSLIEVR